MDVKLILVVSSTRPPATALDLIESLREAGCELRVMSDWVHSGADHLAVGVLPSSRAEDRRRARRNSAPRQAGARRLSFRLSPAAISRCRALGSVEVPGGHEGEGRQKSGTRLDRAVGFRPSRLPGVITGCAAQEPRGAEPQPCLGLLRPTGSHHSRHAGDRRRRKHRRLRAAMGGDPFGR